MAEYNEGEIAGIVIGCLIGIPGLIFLILFLRFCYPFFASFLYVYTEKENISPPNVAVKIIQFGYFRFRPKVCISNVSGVDNFWLLTSFPKARRGGKIP